MAPYIDDKKFTDYIHEHIAIPKIYQPLKWQKTNLDKEKEKEFDMQQGIDYVFKDTAGNLIKVQERFRESKYEEYSDFTIRYRRDRNSHVSSPENRTVLN